MQSKGNRIRKSEKFRGMVLCALIFALFAFPAMAAADEAPLAQGWNLVALPAPPDAVAAALLNLEFFSVSGGAYEAVSPGDVAPGYGYWVYAPRAGALPFSDSEPATEYTIHLKRGWNAVGNPFGEALAWAGNVRVATRLGQVSVVDSGAVAGNLIQFDSSTGQYEQIVQNVQLEPFRAYLIRANEDCDIVIKLESAGGEPVVEPISALPFDEDAVTTDPGTGRAIMAGQVVVSAPGMSLSAAAAAIESAGGEVVGYNAALGLMQVRIPAGAEPAAFAQTLAASGAVADAAPVLVFEKAALPDDPVFTDFDSSNDYHFTAINAAAAWDALGPAPAQPVVIAILDTGVNAGHEELSGRVLPGKNFADGGGDTTDRNGHGTMAAGLAAGAGNNARGAAGLCWDCRVLPVKVLADNGQTSVFTVITGIIYAADNGAKIINLSLSGPTDHGFWEEQFIRAVNYAASKGAVVVGAAGNRGEDAGEYLPAAVSRVITVAATGANGARAEFSNYGSYVDLAATGAQVYANNLSDYEKWSGTSVSAPLVAGAAALLAREHPDWTPAQIEQALVTTARPVQPVQPMGAGVLDVAAALAADPAGGSPGGGTVEPGGGSGGGSDPGMGAAAPACSVTNALDSGAGSLRNCIAFANANPGVTITFTISNTYISLASALPAITAANTVIDGTGRNVIVGGDYSGFDGFRLQSNNITIKGLALVRFYSNLADVAAVRMTGAASNNNHVFGCRIGTNFSDSLGYHNRHGIIIEGGAHDNEIGDGTTINRNIISGNATSQHNTLMNGVWIKDSPDNDILGNYIGTKSNGMEYLRNDGNGVLIEGAASLRNNVGDAVIFGYGNVISGNASIAGNEGNGIYLKGASYTEIYNNIIGLGADGVTILANDGHGILLEGAANFNTIGGTADLQRNIISNNKDGLFFKRIGMNAPNDNQVYNNYIGTDKTGKISVPNKQHGVNFEAGTRNKIGGTAPYQGNVISGNSGFGIMLNKPETTGNTIQGNRIGIGVDGSALGNLWGGITIVSDANNNVIGSRIVSEAGENIIAYHTRNNGDGIRVTGNDSINNQFFKNSIYGNAGLGIDLGNDGVTPNGSGPAGPNNYRDYPVLTNIVPRGGGCYDFSGTKAANSHAAIYKAGYPAGSIDPDPTGYGEGYAYISVSSSAYAGTSFAFTNLCITGATTVTFLAYDTNGNTSEFGRNFELTAVPVVSNVQFTSNPIIANGVHTSVVTADVSYGNGLAFMQSVTADLSPVGGGTATMYDDGAHSDGAAGDGKYGSAPFTAAEGTPGPSKIITVTAKDKINNTGTGNGTLNITTPANPCPGYSVTSNADSGDGTLRACIEKANGTPAADTITFNIANATITPTMPYTITATGGPLTINAQGKNIVIDGNLCTYCDGFEVLADGVTINGLAMVRYPGNGHHAISIESDNATVQNCRIGTNWSDASGLGNYGGIFVEGASADILDNEIVGSTGVGLTLAGSDTHSAIVKRNYIGVKSDGNTALGNQGGGILIANGAHDNTIGGDIATSWNVISGNIPKSGITIDGIGANNNLIQGNLIGTNKLGTTAIPNDAGITLKGGSSSIIGGDLDSTSNIISGNSNEGVEILNTTHADFKGNHIGLNKNGNGIIPNTVGIAFAGTGSGLTSILSGQELYIGGNTSGGITITSATNCNIRKARIGVMRDNISPAGNGANGIFVASSSNIYIGGNSGGGNIIAFNNYDGVSIAPTGNAEVIGNRIYNNLDYGISNDAFSYNLTITSIIPNGPNYNISGTSTCTTAGCRVQLYRVDDTASGVGQETFNAPPAAGEGFQYLGETTTTVGTGAWAFTNMAVTGGNYITATIIKDGDTTPFCPNKALPSPDPCPGNIVTSAADSGNGTLRACIEKANGTPGAETITFAISNTTISPATTYTVQAAGGDLFIDGTGKNIVIDGASCAGCDGFTVLADDFQLKSVAVTRFNGAGKYGIKVTADNARIQSNRIGTNFGDAAGLGNAGGVYVQGENCYVIGNIVAGNTGAGVTLDGAVTNGCDIKGNYIGIKSDGATALGNGAGGVLIQGGAHDNIIGGDIALGEGNVISGQGAGAFGVSITGAGSTGNTVWGNIIGLNAAGTAALPNKHGVQVFSGADNTTIGGARASHGNVISGNSNTGINIWNSNNTTVAGNLIGLNKAGNGKIGNNIGVYASGANTCKIGTTIAGQENYIGGNSSYGVMLAGAAGCSVLSARIGLQTDNVSAAGNTGSGIHVAAASSNITIGNTTGAGNIVTFSGGHGVEIAGAPPGVAVSGNSIYNNAGRGILSATNYNLAITAITPNGLNYDVSGTSICSGCKVQLYQVDYPANGIMDDNATTPPAGEGFKYLGEKATAAGGAWSFTNVAVSGGDFVTALMIDASQNTTEFAVNRQLPPPDACPGNTVTSAADSGDGTLRACLLKAQSAPGSTITFAAGIANSAIKPQTELPAVTANDTTIDGGTRNITIDGSYPCANCNGLTLRGIGGAVKNLTIVNFNTATRSGIVIDGGSGGGKNYTITGCKIGTDGTVKKANDYGVSIVMSAQNNTIGGTTAAEANTIAGNTAQGVSITGVNTSGNTVKNNYIGTNAAGAATLGNVLNGVRIGNSALNNTVTSDSGLMQVIAFNGQAGVRVESAASDNNRILTNKIHSNTGVGIDLDGAGANNNSAAPAIVVLTLVSPGVYNISGTSACGAGCTVQIFRVDDTASGIGQDNALVPPAGEAFAYVNVTTTIAGGAWSFPSQSVSGGQYITATITDGSGNTSEFAGNKQLPSDMCAGFIVSTLANSGVGSLRECMLKANSEPTSDVITFSVSGTITPLTELPTLTGNGTTISGGGNITLDGNGANFNGIVIQSNNNVVRDMAVMRFSGAGRAGVLIDGGDANTVQGCKIGNDGTNARGNVYGVQLKNGAAWNTIGGDAASERNVISGNTTGVYITGAATERNKITGNHIGLNAAGAGAVANARGVYLAGGANNTTIGGPAAADRNVISGNTSEGILINASSNNFAIGNYIGTSASGLSPLPNQTNIKIEGGAATNFIGGPTASTRNVIAAATQDGVWLVSNQNNVQGNYIGVNKDGQRTAGMGNGRHGIYVQGASNKIGGSGAGQSPNLVARGGVAGIYVTAGTLNSISQNVIYDNAGAGIDLVAGGNANIAAPTITYARYSSPGFADISGTSVCGSGCTVELYRADDTGAGIVQEVAGEGFAYLGAATTAADGAWSFTGVIFSGGEYVTATITSAAGNGNTSEFATNRKVVFNAAPVITLSTASSIDISIGETITLNATATDADGDPLTYTWSGGGASRFSATNSVTTQWTGPLDAYTAPITVTVSDGHGGSAAAAIPVRVGIKDAYQFMGIPSVLTAGPGSISKIEFYGQFTTGHLLRVNPETVSLDSNIGSISIGNKFIEYNAAGGVYSETLTATLGNYTDVIPIEIQ